MIAYLPITEHGSPEWEKARRRKQFDRRAALRDEASAKAFEQKYGHPPEESTVDEYQEAHSVRSAD